MSSSNNADVKTDDSSADKRVALKDIQIRISENTYIKVSTLVAIILTAISTTWFVAEYATRQTERAFQTEKDSLHNEIKDKTYKLEDARTDIEVLKQKYAVLHSDYTELQKLSKVPIILSPVSGKRITGRYVTFRWKYDTNPGFQNFVLELKHIDKDTNKSLTRRYQIPEPERKVMHFEFPIEVAGEFFWRIGTGEILASHIAESPATESDSTGGAGAVKKIKKETIESTEAKSVPDETRLWSRYGHFEVYPSLLEKVKSTQEITVGMTAAFLSYDHPVSCDGRPSTYDMDFIEWVIERLSFELKRPIKIVRKITIWDNLLKMVATGDLDIAIANITKSKSREDDFVGISFTDGYRDSYQRIIYSKNKYKELSGRKLTEKELKPYLQGAIVGAQVETINYRAAEYLRKRFGFTTNGTYKSYVDVIDAIRRGKIQFGMLDSVRMQTVAYPEIGVIEFDDKFKFYELLDDFNHSQLGYKGPEKYAIAVFTGGVKTEFLTKLNSIINSDAGKKKRQSLEKEHSFTNKTKNVFSCN